MDCEPLEGTDEERIREKKNRLSVRVLVVVELETHLHTTVGRQATQSLPTPPLLSLLLSLAVRNLNVRLLKTAQSQRQ